MGTLLNRRTSGTLVSSCLFFFFFPPFPRGPLAGVQRYTGKATNMIVTIRNDPETGVSVSRFDEVSLQWVEVGRLEPGEPETRAVETGSPALVVKWQFKKGYEVVQIQVSRER